MTHGAFMESQLAARRVAPNDLLTLARKKWLAGGGVASGRIKIDKGAQIALTNQKSLLAVGVEKILSPFEKGEIVEIMATSKMPVAVAIAKLSSSDLEIRFKEKNLEVAHVDDIVVF